MIPIAVFADGLMPIKAIALLELDILHERERVYGLCCWLNSLTTKKQTTKFSYANLKKKCKSKLHHTENSKTRGQTV